MLPPPTCQRSSSKQQSVGLVEVNKRVARLAPAPSSVGNGREVEITTNATFDEVVATTKRFDDFQAKIRLDKGTSMRNSYTENNHGGSAQDMLTSSSGTLERPWLKDEITVAAESPSAMHIRT